MLIFSLVHLALYATLFFLAVRKIRRPATAAIVLAGALAISFAPIYGSGENLGAGGKLTRSAWQVYAEEFKR
jgi:hypothetical protein